MRGKRTLQCWVDRLEGLIDLLTHFGASEHNLATDEDQQNNLWLDHSVDQTREQFRLVRAERVMFTSKTLQSNWKLDIAGTDNVLDLEVGELGIEAELLNDSSIFSRGQL